MPRVSVEYAAGFFDGEGHVHIHRPRGRRGWALDVGISQNDRRPLDAIKERWGGQVNGPRVNGQYEWRISTRQAEAFLREIHPFTIVKDEQIAIVLEFREGMKRVGCKGMPAHETERRYECHRRLSEARWTGKRVV